MHYAELQPSGRLQPFVRCVWFLRASEGDLARPERLVPDGCPEIVLNRADPFRRIDGEAHVQPRTLLVGPLARAIVIEPTGVVDLVGVRFEPGGLHALLGAPMHELVGLDVELRDVAQRLGTELRAAARTRDDDGVVAGVERVLTGALTRDGKRALPRGGLARAAVRVVEAGEPRSANVAEALGIGRRALERLFRAELGLTPKHLVRITRVQAALAELDRGRPWTEIAAGGGWADQSHLIRDFRQLVGLTPVGYVRERGLLGQCFEVRELSHSSKRGSAAVG